ncbi:hypothetical protein CANCADRAFT_2291 [Tortispora caseinolytica NRRL Y-17796]|uniref:ATPase inhibitor, mitochondrial n=1 Tax=Tortispora caseinolytica NRRL Y-17796 TaxID=767744 RepID=A0A1E4TFL1_9ASCO|nr:hypothetical protein CANCADRAFT_2291 [Tortispora caseinolytica NRRL Y-17796]
MLFYAAGDTGAPRSSGDSFTKREKAQEDMYVREKEKEKLDKLKQALAKHRKELDEISKQIDQLGE